MKQIYKRLTALMLVFVIGLSMIPCQIVKADTTSDEIAEKTQEAINKILQNGETRQHAYLACLFDESSMSYITVPMIGSSEMEKSHITGLYDMSSDNMVNLNGSVLAKGFKTNSKKTIKITKKGISATAVTEPSEAYNQIPGPLSFPCITREATDADINRAYQISRNLGNEFMDAMLFLNDGHSYADINSYEYIMEMRYFLLSCMGNRKEGGTGYIINSYGHKYCVNYDTPTVGKVTITQEGQFTKLKKTGDKIGGRNSKYVYRPEEEWDADSYVENSGSKKISEVFTYKLKKGYYKTKSSVKNKVVRDTTFEDGTKNNLPVSGQVDNFDVEWLNWAHLVLEADLLYSQGIAFNNSGDLYNKSVTDSVIVETMGKAVSSIESKLGLWPLSYLVYNKGVIGSDAYVYGVFPSEWLPNMEFFFAIMTVIAFSVVIIAVLYNIYKFGVLDDGSRIATRRAVVSLFYNVLVAVLGIAFFIPLFMIFLKLSNLIINVFSGIADVSPRGIEGLLPSDSYSSIGAIVFKIVKLVLETYLNVLYIIRRLVIMGLFCFAPIFIVFYAFGEKGKQITGAWLNELIGNVIIQIVHAGVFALLCTVTSGLRGIEGITMVACIIPITSLFRGLITRGGSLTQSLGTKLTAGGLAAGVAANQAVVSGASNAVGGTLSAFGHERTGSVFKAAGSLNSGLTSAMYGAGMANVLGGEDGTGGHMLSQGTGQAANAPKELRGNSRRDGGIQSSGNSQNAAPKNSGNGNGGIPNTVKTDRLKGLGMKNNPMFDAPSMTYTNDDGKAVEQRGSSWGSFNNMAFTDDTKKTIQGQLTCDPASATDEQTKNFSRLRSAYNNAYKTASDKGLTGVARDDYASSQMKKYGFDDFRMPNRAGDTANVKYANKGGVSNIKSVGDGKVEFTF